MCGRRAVSRVLFATGGPCKLFGVVARPPGLVLEMERIGDEVAVGPGGNWLTAFLSTSAISSALLLHRLGSFSVSSLRGLLMAGRPWGRCSLRGSENGPGALCLVG